MLRRLFRRIRNSDGVRGDDDHVSLATRLAHQYHEDTRGVDLPRWKTPQELAEMRRSERRAALRMVEGGKR